MRNAASLSSEIGEIISENILSKRVCILLSWTLMSFMFECLQKGKIYFGELSSDRNVFDIKIVSSYNL